MSLGMFSAIPLPFRVWDESCQNLMLPFFPVVGAVLGLCWWGLAQLLLISGVHLMLITAILSVTPFVLSGFLHLDGYMDTCDAILSRRPLEDKIRILKDPHAGAFAVIMVSILFLLQFAASYAVAEAGSNLSLLLPIMVASRCYVSLALPALKQLPHSSLARMMTSDTKPIHTICAAGVLASAWIMSYLIAGVTGLWVLAALTAGFALATRQAYKAFGGLSGDLAGYALVAGELCGLLCLAVL